ncbi:MULTISPECIES: MarR family winged helix-turn-helix transcriptional regulator [unclassified Salinibacterium]|uniref:MarR family winged helix-turn-helix transcriptional regulator n=1 Tax=unclassified Salinibacterium TaxID=2632331 RepID=UPI00142401E0|nr:MULTISPECIES: MarR family winged helix-turn-helix transcriptional regulator [unclassified Salinibacterium]
MSEVSEVSTQEWTVWRTFHMMRRQLDRALEGQLQRDAGISAADYEVLLALFESRDNQLRSRDLGELIGWEKSRISHQVSRMESRGLVERRECSDDLRGTWVGLTANGRRAILGAMREHASKIRQLFLDVLTDDEKAALLAASVRVLDTIAPPVCDDVAPGRPAAAG